MQGVSGVSADSSFPLRSPTPIEVQQGITACKSALTLEDRKEQMEGLRELGELAQIADIGPSMCHWLQPTTLDDLRKVRDFSIANLFTNGKMGTPQEHRRHLMACQGAKLLHNTLARLSAQEQGVPVKPDHLYPFEQYVPVTPESLVIAEPRVSWW